MVYAFQGMIPVVHESSFVHPQATVIGHVTIGPDCYVGPGAVLRGDWGKIILERGVNVQECAVIHMFPGTTVLLEEGAHIGHGAMIHGARVGRNAMVGMNAVLLDDVVLGDECIVGALALVRAGSSWPKRSLIIGHPAERKGQVSDSMVAHKTEGTALYQRLPAECHEGLIEVEPLRHDPNNRPEVFPEFETWQKRRQDSDSSAD